MVARWWGLHAINCSGNPLYGQAALIVATSPNGITAPLPGHEMTRSFFDLDQFHKITGDTATGFNNPGNYSTFAGTNVMSVVLEVPKIFIGQHRQIRRMVKNSTESLIHTKKKLRS